MTKISIPFAPPCLSQKEEQEVLDTLRSGWLSMGPKVKQFEEDFCQYTGAEYSVSVNSCTAGLFLSLQLFDLFPEDEVITTPFTFAATANTIVHSGAKPVFVDIDEKTWNIDPQKIEEKITKKTKGIVVVHYGGETADIEAIEKIAQKHNLFVIEDAAHAVGAKYSDGKNVGSRGNLTNFSFYATKNMTTGEGGMVTTNNLDYFHALQSLRLHGINKNDAWKRYQEKGMWQYDIEMAGFKCNMTDLNAALGIHQLRKIDNFNAKRKKIWEIYREELGSLPLRFQLLQKDRLSAYHLFPLVLLEGERENFISFLSEKGIATSVHFIPLHLMSFYQKQFGCKEGDFPITEKVFSGLVTLPLYPQLSREDQAYIIKSIHDFFLNKN